VDSIKTGNSSSVW